MQASLVGKGKKTNTPSQVPERRSAPLSTLKDPAVFGPPPKNVSYHGSPTVPATASPTAPGNNREDALAQPNPLAATDREWESSGPPPVPVRANTTVPVMADARQAPPTGVSLHGEAVGTDRPPVPPRLPPRGSSDTTTTQVNQGALNRLGQAGISVPGLDIGRQPRPQTPRDDGRTTNPIRNLSSTDGAKASQLTDLGSRFSKLATSSETTSSPKEGTSFAQKQAALRTASSLYKDPTSVTVSDAKSAASTANNFKQRHGSQVAQGWQAANRLNDQLQFTEATNPQRSVESDTISTETLEHPPLAERAGPRKAPPPPPPPKKRELSANVTGAAEPPPIPLASKPR